jgi:hypothetical protein
MRDWQGLTTRILESLGDHVAGQGFPTWVKVVDGQSRDDSFTLACLDDPGGLMGWSAPPEVSAVGVVATGRLLMEPGPSEAPAPLRAAKNGGIRLACVVARDGTTGWRMVIPGGRAMENVPEDGRLLDCLKRCLGLPTPPAPTGPGRLQSLLWLDKILGQAQTSPHRLSWNEVVRLHPAGALLDPGEQGALSPEDLAHVIRLAGTVWSWEEIRQQAATRWSGQIIERDIAAWMDEGMFARWMLGGLPGTDELMTQVRPLLTPSTARRLAHALHSVAA